MARWRPDGSRRFAISSREKNRGAFKTPTLREIAATGPYTHDGSLARLDDVVEFYSKGGRANPSLDSLMALKDFTAQEKTALIAFLKALKGQIRKGSH